MNILNFIEAYDLDKSKYKYNKTGHCFIFNKYSLSKLDALELQQNSTSGQLWQGTDGTDDVVKEVPKTKPNQVHHYASDKNKTYTSQFDDIAKKYNNIWPTLIIYSLVRQDNSIKPTFFYIRIFNFINIH